jgi:hypothetical protein
MAKREVFADTSGLYALVNKNDACHAAAREAVAALLHDDRRLVVTDYVIDESVTFAKARGGMPVANRVLDLIERSQGCGSSGSAPTDSRQRERTFASMPITGIRSRTAAASS